MSLASLAVRVGEPAAEGRPQLFVGHAGSSVDVAWPLREIRANHFVTTTDAATERTRV